MVDKQVRIDLTATDNASRVVDDVAKSVDELEKTEPKVEITADGSEAKTEIDDVDQKARDLAEQKVRLTVEAGMSGVLGDLAELRDDLDKTSHAADDTGRHLDGVDRPSGGGNLRGQAIADLTGPLGDVSSKASDLAGVFDGIGDITESVAAKVGVSAATMSSAIGGIGFAVIAATTLWGLFTGAQEKARKKQQELIEGQQKLNDKISEGRYADAAAEFEKLYGGALRAAEKLGVPTQELIDFVTGVSDSAPTAVAALQTVEDAGAQMGATFVNGRLVMGTEVAGMVQAITDARGEFATTNTTLATSKTRTDAVARALQDSAGSADDAALAQQRLKQAADDTSGAFDTMRGSLNMTQDLNNLNAELDTAMTNAQTGAENTSSDILQIKQDIVTVGQAAHANPIEVATLLDRIDAGDYAGVKSLVEQMSKNNPTVIATTLAPPIQRSARPGEVSPSMVPIPGPGPAPSFTQQIVYVPLGAPGPAARRNGARYGSSTVAGARR